MPPYCLLKIFQNMIIMLAKIGQLNHLEIKIGSIDVFPDSTAMHLQTSLSSSSSSTTGGLSSLLKLKKGVRIMITSNID